MRYAKYALLSLFFLFLLPTFAGALEVVQKDEYSLNIGGRAQVFGLAQTVDDSVRNDARIYLFLRQARLKFFGDIDKIKYDVELAFAGEEEVRAPNPGVSLNLLDFSFDIPIWETLYLKVGQFKVPYSRERLVDSSALQFTTRSIHNLAFRMGRDVGAVLHAYPNNMALALGVFTGAGRDVPERFLPQNLGVPMFVFRAGYDNGVDEDIFSKKQNEFEIDRTKIAAFVNALYMKDSLVGHSTVLNVKTAEKSLLNNSNWNPFVNRSPLNKGDLYQIGADVAVRTPLGPFLLASEIEGNYGRYSNAYGNIDLVGGRAQAGLMKGPIEAVLRYAFIMPDKNFANSGTSLTGGKWIHEVTPGLNYYIKKNRAKISLDFPLLIDVPVVTETGVGAYVLTEQPDQSSIVAPDSTGTPKGTIARKFVAEARLLFQLAF